MQLITLTERELDALYGEPAEVLKLYICLRRRMDFETGLVGAEKEVSWWALREDMFVEFAQGRRRDESGTPTEKMVRNKVERLVSIGLVESRTSYRKLVFFLPMAHKGQLRLKKVGQTWGGQAGRTLEGVETVDAQGVDENYPQEAGRIETREVGHTSGIRVNPFSEYKQQQTECLVDNFAALPHREIANWIRAAENRRGKIVAISEADPHIKSWVSNGVDAVVLEDAHASAVAARQRDSSPAPINVGFLNRFIEQALATRKPWHQSASGIERKAQELGLKLKPGQPFPDFKRLVFGAVGLTEDEVRTWQP